MRACALSILRRGLTRRCSASRLHLSCRAFFCSPTQLLRRNPPAADDSDFVDIDFLSLGITADGVPALSLLHPNSDALVGDILGVTRRTELPEGTELSRFDIPLEAPTGGRPIPRPHSRAAFAVGEEAKLAEEQTIAKDAGHAADDGEPADMALALANALVEGQAGCFSALPQPDTTLPYDDDAFAETLLQMEVDGVIDEAWQDSRKAHLEDVKEVTEILKSVKVRDICGIDVSSKTGNFDYMLFGTCEGSRHIHLAAWAAQEADSLKRSSKIPRKKSDELWEVVPIGRIVLNLMVENLRDELTLERKWAVTSSMDPLGAANAPVSEGRNVRAHGLWTLTLNLQDLEDFEVDYCKDVLLRQL